LDACDFFSLGVVFFPFFIVGCSLGFAGFSFSPLKQNEGGDLGPPQRVFFFFFFFGRGFFLLAPFPPGSLREGCLGSFVQSMTETLFPGPLGFSFFFSEGLSSDPSPFSCLCRGLSLDPPVARMQDFLGIFFWAAGHLLTTLLLGLGFFFSRTGSLVIFDPSLFPFYRL